MAINAELEHGTPIEEIQYWYVMTHLEPMMIDRQLQTENERRSRQGLPAILYVIPFRYMVRANVERATDNNSDMMRQCSQSAKEADDNNELRDFLHGFVFVKASQREIFRLIHSEWNRTGRLHLLHYRTKSGIPIRIKQEEMQPMLTFFIEQRQRFSFTPYSDEMLVNEKVFIKTGVFKNYEATIMEIHHTAEGVNLTLGIPMFQSEVMMELYDYSVSDIEVSGRKDDIFSPQFIKTIEADLLGILRRRIMHRDTHETHLQDQEKLNRYSILNYLKFEDTATHNHFRALMLLCASLRRDKHTKEALVIHVRQMLNSSEIPDNDDDAFLQAVLFVATKDVDYCRRAREYCRTHDVCSDSLKAIMPLVKKMPLR